MTFFTQFVLIHSNTLITSTSRWLGAARNYRVIDFKVIICAHTQTISRHLIEFAEFNFFMCIANTNVNDRPRYYYGTKYLWIMFHCQLFRYYTSNIYFPHTLFCTSLLSFISHSHLDFNNKLTLHGNHLFLRRTNENLLAAWKYIRQHYELTCRSISSIDVFIWNMFEINYSRMLRKKQRKRNRPERSLKCLRNLNNASKDVARKI